VSVLIPAAAKLAGPVQRLIAMGIDAGIKPGELYVVWLKYAASPQNRDRKHKRGGLDCENLLATMPP